VTTRTRGLEKLWSDAPTSPAGVYQILQLRARKGGQCKRGPCCLVSARSDLSLRSSVRAADLKFPTSKTCSRAQASPIAHHETAKISHCVDKQISCTVMCEQLTFLVPEFGRAHSVPWRDFFFCALTCKETHQGHSGVHGNPNKDMPSKQISNLESA
jgi:hypothetical protein